MVGQTESDDIFVSELKVKELTMTGSSVLLFLFQWEINMLIYYYGFSNFWHTNKNFYFAPLYSFCPTLTCFLFPHYTLFVMTS